MDRAERERAIAEYEDGYRVVTEALVGATDRGKWSIILPTAK